jgi:predicted N-acetyltransferase YhbS
MPDLLVKLYELPDDRLLIDQLTREGITIRNSMAYEKLQVVQWVQDTFGKLWASECDTAFGNRPISCFVAIRDFSLVGFACHDCTMKNFFGPLGVIENVEKKGVGSALLLRCLHVMATSGYAYAVIGDAKNSSIDFYKKTVNALEIAESYPGIYRNRLRG